MNRKVAIITFFSALTVAIAMGTRHSLGLFLEPISSDLSIGRETFSLAVAFQNILFGLPLAGILSDKIVLAGSSLVGHSSTPPPLFCSHRRSIPSDSISLWE